MRTAKLSLIVLFVLTACARPTLAALPPEEIISKAAGRMKALTSFHFVIDRSGAPAYLDPNYTFVLNRMEGDYAVPDKVQGQARVVGPGLVVSLRFVSIGLQYWETNVLTGAWTECPNGQCFNPAVLFDPEVGLQAVLQSDFINLKRADDAEMEEMPGKLLYVVTGQLTGEKLAEMSWGMIGPEMMTAKVWVDPKTFDTYRVEIDEPAPPQAPTPAPGTPNADTTHWKVDFLNFNQAIEILPPPNPYPSPMKRPVSPALVIALISIPIFVGALDLTVVSAVLPHVVYDLQIPQTEINSAAWIVSGYLLAYTVAMTFMGRLSDLVGRRKVYLLALAIFAIGSYLVAVADQWPVQMALRVYYQFFEGRPDPARVALDLLVAARMIQAFGGGAMVPVGMALAGDLYPAERRAQALGMIAAVDTAGWVVGHLYGGIVTRYFNWRLIFWLNLPVCLIGFLLIALVLRGLPKLPPSGRMDWPGALLIALSLAALNIGLGSSESGGTFSTQAGLPAYALPVVAVAIVLLALFIARQLRAKYPLMPLGLFRQANFAAASLANFLIGFCLFIGIANVPLFINTLVAQTLEQGAWDSGWLLSALTVPMALAAIPAGWLTDRWGYRLPALAGGAMAAIGFGWMTTWRAASPYGMMIPQLVFAGIGLGLVITPIAAAALNAAPSTHRGTASALVIIFRLVGMTISVSAMASYGQARFNALSTQFVAEGSELVNAGIDAVTQVIGETFWIAAAAAALALIPILFLYTTKGGNHEQS